jgi:hypothetical protein
MPAALPRILVGVLLAGCFLVPSLRAADPIDPPLSPLSPPPPPDNTAGIIPEAPNWVTMRPEDRERGKLTNRSDLEWGSLKSECTWRAPDSGRDPTLERGEWSTQNQLAIPVTGPLHLFTEVSLGGDYVADPTLVGKTGVLWKMPLGEGAPLEVSGGPALKHNDPMHPFRASNQASLLWELKAKATLVGSLGVEYLGVASPAMTPEDHSLLKQDVGLFLPINGGKLKLGARHTWDATQQDTRSANNPMEWYLGIEIGR